MQYTNTQVYKYTNTQTLKYTNTQILKYSNTQIPVKICQVEQASGVAGVEIERTKEQNLGLNDLSNE